MKRLALSVFGPVLFVLACHSIGSVPVQEATYYGPEAIEGIQQEIEANWRALGYTEKPSRYIAISFDDGPAGARTQDLLNILEEKQVKATFFLIGQNIRGQKIYAQAIFNAGHELGNHSDGYIGLGYNASLGEDTAETVIRPSLEQASAELRGISGVAPVYFRAPNVNYGDALAKVCADMGLVIVGVSVWSHDWQQNITSEQILNNVLANPQDGDIINCHEPNTAPNTLAALPAMIDGLRAKGFWIMSVGQLAAIKGKTLEAGIRYDSIR